MLQGSFIQSWYCVDLSDDQWEEEFIRMKKLGMRYLIVADLFDQLSKKQGRVWNTYFDAQTPQLAQNQNCQSEEMLPRLFALAKKHQMQLFLGTGSFSQWWKKGARSGDILSFYQTAVLAVEELYNRYVRQTPEAFAGWYFVPEIANIPRLGYGRPLVEAMNLLIATISRLTPEHPLLLSPYYNEYLGKTPVRFEESWARILREVAFRPIDILAPQDAIGAGWTTFDQLDQVMRMYLGAIEKSGKKLRFWVNCENFTQNHKGLPLSPPRTKNARFVPAPVGRFIQQMEQARQYTDQLITFSYNHYYSPNNAHSDFDRALACYIETGKIHTAPPVFSEGGAVQRTQGDTMAVSWRAPDSDWAIACYEIEKNGRFFCNLDTRLKSGYVIEPVFSDRLQKGAFYEIVAVDVWGNRSEPLAVTVE